MGDWWCDLGLIYFAINGYDLSNFGVSISLAIIEDGYHWRNPYHNAVHAADVTQAMHCFLQESMILEKLTPIEILSALLAAATHDLDHPGVNQPFLVATSNHLAALYKVSIFYTLEFIYVLTSTK